MQRDDSSAVPEGKVLVLRTVESDMTSHGGFVWPESGDVEARDWKPTKECGNGLHGLLWGQGSVSLMPVGRDRKALVVEVEEAGLIDFGGKCKFGRGRVVYCGELADAVALIQSDPRGLLCAYGTATAGYDGTATAGDRGTATAGDHGTATAGAYGTATAGDRGTATAGYDGTATAGHRGTATAGDRGTATAGYDGTATAGHRGTATAGAYGTATAGYDGTLVIRQWDTPMERYRLRVAYVGEDGIKPGVPYRLDGAGKFEEIEREERQQ